MLKLNQHWVGGSVKRPSFLNVSHTHKNKTVMILISEEFTNSEFWFCAGLVSGEILTTIFWLHEWTGYKVTSAALKVTLGNTLMTLCNLFD